MSLPVELLASFKQLRVLDIAFTTQRIKVLWDKGFHIKIKERLRFQKCGARFSHISFMTGVGYASYSYAADGTETCLEDS
jgi:hypothetical protein